MCIQDFKSRWPFLALAPVCIGNYVLAIAHAATHIKSQKISGLG
jgi:hypothetical protein